MTTLHDLQEELNDIKIQIGVEKKLLQKKKTDLKGLRIKSLADAKEVYKHTNKEINSLNKRLEKLTNAAEEILYKIEGEED